MANREELSAAFIAALSEDYAQSGEQALARVRNEAPERYLSLVAALVPRAQPEPQVENKYTAMTKEELLECIAGFPVVDEVEVIARALPKWENLLKKARKRAKREGYTWPPLSPRKEWIAAHKGQFIAEEEPKGND